MNENRNSFTGAVCQHVRLNGEPCTQPARRHSNFCRFHDAAMQPLPEARNLRDQLPVLDDESAIQVAIMRVLRHLMSGPIDRKEASTILYGLQLASTNLSRKRQRTDNRVPSRCEAGAENCPPQIDGERQ